jgi:hypothetical protein
MSNPSTRTNLIVLIDSGEGKMFVTFSLRLPSYPTNPDKVKQFLFRGRLVNANSRRGKH